MCRWAQHYHRNAAGKCVRHLTAIDESTANFFSPGLPRIEPKSKTRFESCDQALTYSTRQVANKLYRSYSGFMPAKEQESLLQVSKLVSTGQADTSALPMIDLQRAFSRPAVVADNVANNLKQVLIRVDNAVRAGYSYMCFEAHSTPLSLLIYLLRTKLTRQFRVPDQCAGSRLTPPFS